MRDGFLKVAAATPEVRVADCAWNRAQTAELMRQAAEQGVKVVCFPELGLTGYTCADLFLQSTLLRGAERALEELMAETEDLDLLACVGVPVRVRGKLYNCAAVFCRGELLGLVPKTNIPNYTEFYEGRWFTGGAAFGDTDFCISYAGQEGVEFSTALVFRCASFPALTVGVEICEDVGGGHPLHPAVRRGRDADPESLRQRRDRQQGGVAAHAAEPPPPDGWPAAMSTPTRAGGELHRPHLRRARPHSGERLPFGRAPVRHRPDRQRDRPGKAGARAPAHEHVPRRRRGLSGLF